MPDAVTTYHAKLSMVVKNPGEPDRYIENEDETTLTDEQVKTILRYLASQQSNN